MSSWRFIVLFAYKTVFISLETNNYETDDEDTENIAVQLHAVSFSDYMQDTAVQLYAV